MRRVEEECWLCPYSLRVSHVSAAVDSAASSSSPLSFPTSSAAAAHSLPRSSAVASSAAPAFSRKEFEVDGFDAKRWINALLRKTPSGAQQTGDGLGTSPSPSSALSTLVMKLQLTMADVDAALSQASNELFTGLPKSAHASSVALALPLCPPLR